MQPAYVLLNLFIDHLRNGDHSPTVTCFADSMQVETTPRWVPPTRDVPAITYLDAVLASPAPAGMADIHRALAAVAPNLAWTPFYDRTPLTESFVDKAAMAMVVAATGPLAHPDVIVGIDVIGDNTVYPLHWHAAEEIYYIVAGTPYFRIGSSDWQARRPGEAAHIPADVPHAICNGDQPMIALYCWRGATQSEPRFPVDTAGHPANVVTIHAKSGDSTTT